MQSARRGLIPLLLVSASAWARPVPVGTPTHGRSLGEPHLALRVVIATRAGKWANCVFTAEPIAEAAGAGAPLKNEFRGNDPIWARCYFPASMSVPKLGLVDRFYVDDAKVPTWEQAYEQPAPTGLSRSLDFGDVLRGVLPGLKPGPHRIRVEGTLRRGDRGTMLYRGDFRYVR